MESLGYIVSLNVEIVVFIILTVTARVSVGVQEILGYCNYDNTYTYKYNQVISLKLQKN